MIPSLDQIAFMSSVPTWLLIVLLVWSGIWKFIALWKSARNNHMIWFVVFFLIQTAGILEILYIFLFSKLSKGKKSSRKKNGNKV